MKRLNKTAFWLIIGAMSCFAAACGDDKDDNNGPKNPEGAAKEIVGRWQKYALVETNGSLSGGDPDEFWIFNSDGSFINEDSGEITTKGTYVVEGNTLTIMSQEVDGDLEEENFTGTFKIDGQYMDYTFTEIGDEDFITYRFLKQ